MKISIVTLFPQMFTGPLSESILKKASEKKLLEIEYVDIRNFGLGKHKMVDDTPYGGGVGMLLRVDVLKKALDSTQCKEKNCREEIILLDPKGTVFSQGKASILSHFDHLILICPHYEGVDERFKKYIDEEISIGDYIVTGGEIPAMVVIDAVARLIPGVLGKDLSSRDESFSFEGEELLEYPQFTRPEEFEGQNVPKILLSGNHAQITQWKKDAAKKTTSKKRPDLLSRKR